MGKLQFLFIYLRKHAWSYSFGIVFIVLTNWIAVSIPQYIQKSIDLIAVGYRITEAALSKVEKDIGSGPIFQKLTTMLNLEFQDDEQLLVQLKETLGSDYSEAIKESFIKHSYLTDKLAQNQEELLNYLMIMLGLALAMIVIRTLSRVLFFTPGRAIECEVKNDMFLKLTELQKDYHEKNPSGSVISKLNNDVNGIRLLTGFGMLQTFNILSALSLTPLMMWQISPSLTLYCIIPIIMVFTFVKFGMRFMVTNMRERMGLLQNVSESTVSFLSGVDVIKSFGLQTWVEHSFRNENEAMLKRSLNISWIRSFLLPILSNMENILKVLILSVGGYYVIQAQLTIGELTAYITYAALLTMPLTGLGWVTTMVQQGMVGLESVQTIMNQKVPQSELPKLPPPQKDHLFDQGLVVKNLSYRYSGAKEDTLKEINFQILPGQTIGVLGRIGSGKTTLVNCLNRYLAVEEEKILWGGKDIAKMHHSSFRENIRTVTQDPFLFSDTVKDNITFGCKDDKCEEELDLNKILYESALDEEVQRFPKQEKTLVGEKGIMLSGGQKQRISLARAMTAPCDLLILDNVLSAVDTETEAFLLKQILKKQHARSLLIVSHRAISMESADLILVLEDGNIVDRGTAQELKNRPGYFQEVWKLQNQQ